MTRTTGTVNAVNTNLRAQQKRLAQLSLRMPKITVASLGLLAEDGDCRARVSGGSHKHQRPQHLTTIDDLGDLSAKVWLSSRILGFANDFMRYNLFENT